MNEDPGMPALLEARASARSASTLGIIAITVSLASPCFCYLPAIPAMLFGIVALSKGRHAKLEFPDDDAVSGLADVATVLGLISVLHAAFWITVILLYFLIYAALLATVILSV